MRVQIDSFFHGEFESEIRLLKLPRKCIKMGLEKMISKAPLRGVSAIALDLSLVIQKYQKLTSTSIQNEGCGASFWVVQGFIFDLFWVSGRVLAAKCVLGGVLGGSWVGLGRVLGPSWGPSSASWRRLGGPRRPKTFAKTAQDASKMPPRQPKIRFSAKKFDK